MNKREVRALALHKANALRDISDYTWSQLADLGKRQDALYLQAFGRIDAANRKRLLQKNDQ